MGCRCTLEVGLNSSDNGASSSCIEKASASELWSEIYFTSNDLLFKEQTQSKP